MENSNIVTRTREKYLHTKNKNNPL